MSKYDEGRSQAAFEIMRRIEEDNASIEDVISTINNTLHDQLEKTASEEDMDVKRGIDSFCYDFLKTASDISGTYDLSDVNEDDFLAFILEEMADSESDRLMNKNASLNNYEVEKSSEEDVFETKAVNQSVAEKAQSMRKFASQDKALDIVKALYEEGLI